MFPATVTFGNIPLDAPIGTFEMVAWDDSSGLYPTWTQASAAAQNGLIPWGKSGLFTIANIGGSSNPPPLPIPGLQSFNIFFIPEPATITLAALGAAMLLFRRRKRSV